jgi:hypothetical protein
VGKVLGRRDSELGLLKGIENTETDFGAIFGGMLGASPQTPRICRFGPSTGFAQTCWLALSERKQEWLPKAATVPGGARHSWVQRTCRRHLSDARVASQQSPVLLRDIGGYVSVRRVHPGLRPPWPTAREGDDTETGGRWGTGLGFCRSPPPQRSR